MRFVVPFALMVTLSCQSFKQGIATPSALTCTQIVSGGNTGETLRDALARAGPGACVVVLGATYRGSFEVPKGVTVTSAEGTRATLSGTAADKPALVLEGGAGSGLCGLSIVDSLGVGVAIRGGPVVIKDVSIERSAKTGLTTDCGEGCDASQSITLNDVRVRENMLGAWFRGGTVNWTGGLSSANGSESLFGGTGIVAQDGVALALTRIAVDGNAQAGVIIDGRGGTTARIEDVHVGDNGERGLWAQYLGGDGALSIRGASTLFEANGLVGVGIFRSSGVSVEDATIRGTLAKRTVIGHDNVTIGDGVGIFDQSEHVHVSRVHIAESGRAAALIDSAKGDVVFEGATIAPGPGGLKVVIQRDAAPRASIVPAEDVTATDLLPVPEAVPLESAASAGADAAAD
jgi:hypothetical protein